MTAIPEEAARGFQLGAADYERGRPGYPEAAIAPRERLLDALSDLVAERGLVGGDGLLDTPYRTHVTWCRRLGDGA